jgi:hypothetical protein
MEKKGIELRRAVRFGRESGAVLERVRGRVRFGIVVPAIIEEGRERERQCKGDSREG